MVGGRTILLVEDDPDVRDSLQDVLEDEGFDVVPASNGKQAIDFLMVHDPSRADPVVDLVILDLLMPMVSGWEVLQRMSAEGPLRGVPVIVLSAVLTPRPPRAQGFVRKPFSVEAFVGEIRQVLDGAQQAAPAG